VLSGRLDRGESLAGSAGSKFAKVALLFVFRRLLAVK
jgi:hypothetical protein